MVIVMMRLYEKYEASIPALLPKQNNRDAFFLHLRQVFKINPLSTFPFSAGKLRASLPLFVREGDQRNRGLIRTEDSVTRCVWSISKHENNSN